jgi:hypothetical protein
VNAALGERGRTDRRGRSGWVAAVTLLAVAGLCAAGCRGGPDAPRHRERDPTRDTGCREAGKPSAYFYPAENRTDYKPDDPFADGCMMLVADHLFCCPKAPRATDR